MAMSMMYQAYQNQMDLLGPMAERAVRRLR